MIRRTSIRKGSSPQQKADLWAMRIFWLTGVWEDYRSSDMYDHDDLMQSPWMIQFRTELNEAIALERNADFLRTGRRECARVDHSRGDFLSEAEKRAPAADGEDAPEADAVMPAVPPAKRVDYVLGRLRDDIDEAGSLMSMSGPGSSGSTPKTLGGIWKRVLQSVDMKRWRGSASPQALAREIARLEAADRPGAAGFASPMRENLEEIQKVFGFSDLEVELIGFILFAMETDSLRTILLYFDFAQLGIELAAEVAAVALGRTKAELDRALAPEAPLRRSGLLELSSGNSSDFEERFTFLDDRRFKGLVSTRIPLADLISNTVLKADAGDLPLESYDHLPAVRRVLRPYLRGAVESGERGVNVLLYGMPGTGKTELSRTITREIGASLFEVSTSGDDSTPRLRRWKTAAAFLSSSPNTLLAVDEAEDVFNDHGDGNAEGGRTNKGEINKLLETNPIPTFWITNSIRAIDPAMIRRFDLVLEIPTPPATERRKIVDASFDGKLSERAAQRLVEAPGLAPAVLRRAGKVARAAGFGSGPIREEDVVGIVDSTLRAQGFGRVPEGDLLLPDYYDPALVNCAVDLERVAEGLVRAEGGRICLYGPPGTGKSAYAAWLARTLERPLLRRTASDLMSPYVGMTEALIAAAFDEAKRDGALLVIDEADTFLRDRTLSRVSWETSMVNEMLAQLERFPGVFVATTNLVDTLDAASMRRFDVKMKFDWLRPEQCGRLARRMIEALGLKAEARDIERISGFAHLTPGDFAAVARQHRFRPILTTADLAERLAEETAAKLLAGGATRSKIGFC